MEGKKGGESGMSADGGTPRATEAEGRGREKTFSPCSRIIDWRRVK